MKSWVVALEKLVHTEAMYNEWDIYICIFIYTFKFKNFISTTKKILIYSYNSVSKFKFKLHFKRKQKCSNCSYMFVTKNFRKSI